MSSIFGADLQCIYGSRNFSSPSPSPEPSRVTHYKSHIICDKFARHLRRLNCSVYTQRDDNGGGGAVRGQRNYFAVELAVVRLADRSRCALACDLAGDPLGRDRSRSPRERPGPARVRCDRGRRRIHGAVAGERPAASRHCRPRCTAS